MSWQHKIPPMRFWIISALALIWNLMGVGAFLFETMAGTDAIQARYSPYEAQAVLARPTWATALFGIAVFAAALGCVLLLLRKKAALVLLFLSALCVFLQQFYMWGMTDIAKHLSGAAWIMPIVIPVIAVYLVLFAKKSSRKKWIY